MPHAGTLNLYRLDFYGSALGVSARIAKLTAANIANSSTPGYKARDIDFNRALDAALTGNPAPDAEYVRGLPTGLDGNDVSLDHERLQSAANAQRIRQSLAFLRNDVGDLMTALQPDKGVVAP